MSSLLESSALSLPLPATPTITFSFFGPRLVASILQGVETGIVLTQFVHFWAQSEMEKSHLKALVGYAVVMSL
jgi:hypothetical protein